MGVLAWILGSVAVYFALGWRIASWDMPNIYARLQKTVKAGRCEDCYRHISRDKMDVSNDARTVGTLIMAFWPFCLPYLMMSRSADRHDPIMLAEKVRQREQEIQERDRKIAELERKELGL